MKSPRSVSASRSSSSVSRISGEIGKHVLLGDLLRERGDVRVVDEHDAIDLALREELGDAMRDRLRVLVRGSIGEADVGAGQLAPAESERRASLLPHRDPADGLALGLERALEREGAADDLGVERAREPAISGQRDDRDRLDRLAPLEEGQPHR